MPALTEENLRHLLRRSEFVDRQNRVTELLAAGSIESAVDNIMDVPAVPASFDFLPEDENWQRGQHLANFWLNMMATDSPKPMQEKMALFWHGHLVSNISKVGDAGLMRDQINLYRQSGLGNIAAMAKAMSIQVAMLRYLDNNENEADSPNQNFARELMELFLLEVGNYTEADVEAATAAWTGHSDDWRSDQYVWNDHYHDGSVKQFLGQTINDGGDPRNHGAETIDVMLSTGVVPAGADKVTNRGRPTRDVAAEFLSKKLWIDFAGTTPPTSIIATMRDTLVANNFEAAPWVRAMLTSDEFYAAEVKSGLVRSPIDWSVAMLYAIGARAEEAGSSWLMRSTGQEILRPPNVSGWKINGYYVNASAMEARARVCQRFNWHARRNYWNEDGTGYLQLRGGRLTRAELIDRSPWPEYVPTMTAEQVVDRILELMELRLNPGTRQNVIDHVAAGSVWDRNDALLLIMLSPELHTA